MSLFADRAVTSCQALLYVADSLVASSSAQDLASTSTSKTLDSDLLLAVDDVAQDDEGSSSKHVEDIALLAKFAGLYLIDFGRI